MSMPFLAGTRRALLRPYPDADNNLILRQQKIMRRWIGILGMALPLLLWLGLKWATGHEHTLESISHYYYTRVCSVMVGTISVICLFLMIYKGVALGDRILTTTAGLGGFLVVLFPTDNLLNHLNGADPSVSVTKLCDVPLRVHAHFASAGVFIVSLALLSLFVFTLSGKASPKTPRKKIRNTLYIACGMVMLLSVVLIAFQDTILGWFGITNVQGVTFWGETAAIEAFGLAWFVKGETILKDN